MRFLIDKNTLTNQYRDNIEKRDDLYVMQEVLDEAEYSPAENKRIQKGGLCILRPEKKHLEQLKQVMSECGDNLELIDLYTGRGMADVVMIAYILAERDNPETLFKEEYIIVTKDRGLIRTAEKYGIKWTEDINDWHDEYQTLTNKI